MSESAPADVMARLAAKFGGDPVESSEPEQETQAAETGDATEAEAVETNDAFADLEWEGTTYQVPQSMKDAFMRNEDYTKKTQEIGEQRKSIEHVHSLADAQMREAAFHKSIEPEQQELWLIDSYLKQMSGQNWGEMSVEQMYRQRIEMDQVKDRRQAIQSAIDQKRSTFTNELQSRLSELRGKSRELASKSIKGFGEETEKTIRDYAKSSGFTDLEFERAFLDPRTAPLFWKAMQFDKIEAGTAKAGQTATQVEKALRPGVAARKMPSQVATKLNFGKAMKAAKTSQQKANLIETRLAKGSIFNKGH